jgi:hypothetical protein
MKRFCSAGLMVIALVGCVPASSGESSKAVIEALSIPTFRTGSAETQFGSLEYLGGLSLSSGNSLFGAVSAIRLRPDHRHFVSVLDTGHWLSGAIDRDDNGRLSGISEAAIMPMQDRAGRAHEGKGAMDAEGLALRDGEALVSFEENHRVDVYPDPGFATSPAKGTIPTLIPRKELRANRSLEALMIAPLSSPLAGAAVIVAERSLDGGGNMLAAILEGPLKGRFAVRRYDGFDVSDGVFLPDGDLLLLERRFDMANGIGVQIRRIASGDIKPDAVVDGKVIFQADGDDQIDNMEGIDTFRAEDGAIHLILVSDDNHSILQRSLMLEFRLKE